MNEADIDTLDALCQRMAGFEPGLSLEWLDGYLTAVAASRRRIPPEEWLLRLGEGVFERTFADPADQAAARAPIERRWRELLRDLDPQVLLDAPDEIHLAPLMLEVQPDDLERLRAAGATEAELADLARTGQMWAVGFMDAVSDFEADWPEPEDDDAAEMLDACLSPVGALLLNDEDLLQEAQAHYDGQTLTREQWIDEALMGVQDARLFWLDHPPPAPPQRRVEKVGRNDPCPCGSGQKYKKCHGAEAGDA